MNQPGRIEEGWQEFRRAMEMRGTPLPRRLRALAHRVRRGRGLGVASFGTGDGGGAW